MSPLERVKSESPFYRKGRIIGQFDSRSDSFMQDIELTDLDFNKEIIGSGTYSKVIMATHRKTGKKLALKRIEIDLIKYKNLVMLVNRERQIHQTLLHKNIVRLYCAKQDDQYVYLVMDYH